jgi:N-acetylneuraminic acid mutarotase
MVSAFVTKRLLRVCALAASLFFSGCGAAEAGWREVAPLPEPRWFHAAGLGGDGRIYAFGGYVMDPKTGGQAYGRDDFSLVVYDPPTDTWSRGPAVPLYRYINRYPATKLDAEGNRITVPRDKTHTRRLPHELHGAGAGGRMYWFGNLGPAVFDPSHADWDQPAPPVRYQREDRWEGPLPVFARMQPATATGPDGRIYLLGGLGRRIAEGWPPPHDLLTSAEVYDPGTNTWRELAPMREGRQLFAACFGPDGKLYAFGGYGHTGSVALRPDESFESFEARGAEMERKGLEVLSSVEVYDPATDRWGSRSPMPVGLEGTGAGLGADGKIYLVGGTRSYSNPIARREVYVYDARTDTWSDGPPLGTARQGLALVATPTGRIYAIGGTNEERAFRPGELVGGESGSRGGPLASVEVLETAPVR